MTIHWRRILVVLAVWAAIAGLAAYCGRAPVDPPYCSPDPSECG